MTASETIPFGRPWITDDDIAAVTKVLSGHILTHGPEGKAFEAEFARFMGGDAHCVTVSSCMAALHLSYLHLGVGPGDEVIVPAQTHVATVHAVEMVGARPVFADCDPATGNMTPAAIRAAITERTRAVGIVHFAGIPCDMPAILEVTEPRGIPVVEDCALAVGTRIGGRHAGLFGVSGCFSFYPVKHITTGEGGLFVSKHREVAEAVAKLRAFGVDRSHGERKIPGMYDVAGRGLNYRMSEMQAALGRTQLSRIDTILGRRSDNFAALAAALADEPRIRVLDASAPGTTNAHYCLSVVLAAPREGERDRIVLGLRERGVESSIYYPHPVPRMSYYRSKYGYEPGRFPGAEALSDRSIALPVGPHLGAAEMKRIADTLRAVLKEENS